MAKRFFFGLIQGVVVGGLVGLLATRVLGLAMLSGILAYALAALAGLVIGLIAGKPIWAQDAKIEAGLKALVGAGGAALALFVTQKWLGLSADLSAFGLGAGKL